MVSTSLPKAPEKNIAEMIAERSMRGRQLYLTKRSLITKINEDTYTVPSGAGKGSYTVRYGGEVERCECIDYQVHRGLISCKHLVAVGVGNAARRSGVKEIRTPPSSPAIFSLTPRSSGAGVRAASAVTSPSR